MDRIVEFVEYFWSAPDYRLQRSLLLVFLGTLIAQWVVVGLLERVAQRANGGRLYDIWIKLRRPLMALGWVVGLSYALSVVAQSLSHDLRAEISMARRLVVVAVIAWALLRLAKAGEQLWIKSLGGSSAVDIGTVDSLLLVARVLILTGTGVTMLELAGFSLSALVAFGGAGGIAVGLAAKDLMANLFGAVLVRLDRPFSLGDWIRSPDREIEGTVENIGLRLTKIRTFDQRPLYVPNSAFTTISVENPSRMSNRRVYEYVGVRYDDQAVLVKILQDVRKYLEAHEQVDHDRILMVNLDRFGPSSLDFFIYLFTKTTEWADYHRVKEELLLGILEIVSKNKAEIAFPTQTVHLDSLGSEAAPEPGPRPDSARAALPGANRS
ncbi:MAG: mechanosensitive ion channel family protein [Polyangiaceae bacterium]|nr:mechanosensitive ion channel family protein [Polyangiaceae bacterium]